MYMHILTAMENWILSSPPINPKNAVSAAVIFSLCGKVKPLQKQKVFCVTKFDVKRLYA